jgi:hypothetical protein
MAPPRFHNQRKRLASIEAREAAGESLWTEDFPEPLRVKILKLIGRLDLWNDYRARARDLICEDEGVLHLVSSAFSADYDYSQYVMSGPSAMIPTAIEAWHYAAVELVEEGDPEPDHVVDFTRQFNALLRDYRVSYELIDGEMIPFSSRELHTAVVEPALRLLAKPGWEQVESAYHDALGEIARDQPENAITDAGTALQEALVLLGCTGNALGPLIVSAKRQGIVAAHDVALANWVSADRSNMGDAHNARAARLEDAWLTVHVVGALLLRLSLETQR